MNILVNDKKCNFELDDFPMLISGADKTGTSFFSICLLADLYKKGKKVLLFSAYPAAKEEFKKQIEGFSGDAIIIESGEENALIDTIKNLNDLSERIVLIKNIENYSSKILETVEKLSLVIFSGDLDKCEFSDSLIKRNFTTKIYFSTSPKYVGKISSKKYNGTISLDI